MSGPVIIGVDHGYAAIKTAHFAFPAGLVEYQHEPYTNQDVLTYDGRFFVVGSGRQPLQKDKTATENYYLLTLAAIAKELECRQAGRTASVLLAAGLPLAREPLIQSARAGSERFCSRRTLGKRGNTLCISRFPNGTDGTKDPLFSRRRLIQRFPNFGREKEGFRRYLLRDGGPVSFRYEGRAYEITLSDVLLFPQGYSAVMTQTGLLEEPSVIVADIGGWTVDLMRLDHGIPNAASCRSLELGVIQCLSEMEEQVRRSLGITPSAAQMESVLRGEANGVDEVVKAIVRREGERYVRRVLSALSENGLDPRAAPVLFLGGGAGLVKGCLGALAGLCRPVLLDDVRLNAQGYERIAGRMSDG